jgi:nickel-dependent lactate racemase
LRRNVFFDQAQHKSKFGRCTQLIMLNINEQKTLILESGLARQERHIAVFIAQCI